MRRAPVLAFVAFALGTTAFACIDLFHSTDFSSLCDLDGDAPGCSSALASDASHADAHADANVPPVPLCAADPATARSNAMHACGWLGACEGPIGTNAFGPCMVQALFAFDCAANPNREVRGLAATYWTCLANAKTCDDIDKCVEPARIEGCADIDAAYSGCEGDDAGLSANINSRSACGVTGAFLGAENCAAKGETCAIVASLTAGCVAPTPSTCMNGCSGTIPCESDDGSAPIAVGNDCASVGAGTCVGLASGSTCLADSDASCDASAPVSCSNGVATACGSGVVEHVDCAALFDAGANACDPNAAGANTDVRLACSNVGVACAPDTCSDGTISSCDRGITFTATCASLGLSACSIATIEGESRALCTTPRPGR